MQRRFLLLFTSAVLACGFAAAAAADDAFYLKDGDRVVFYGDSITAGGGYVRDVETYLLTRFPDRKFEIINHGISSETISGTSEIDHTPRRPWALERFDRDIKAWKPTVVVACFGMNDGNYHPFDEARFEKYQAGIRTLIRRVRDECGARLTIMTPPTYDAYQRKNGDPQAKEFGYKYAYLGYDETLAKYAAWLMTLREPNVLVVDLHTAMSRLLAERRRTQVSFTMQPDAVHPNATGHFVMAHTLLKAWNADAPPRDDRAEAVGPNAFRLRASVPWPIAAAVDTETIGKTLAAGGPGTFVYALAGLPPGRYRVDEQVLDGDAKLLHGFDRLTALGIFTHAELAAGIDLARLEKFSGTAIGRIVAAHQENGAKATYAHWRKSIAPVAPVTDVRKPTTEDEAATIARRAEESLATARSLCRPYQLELRLTRVDE